MNFEGKNNHEHTDTFISNGVRCPKAAIFDLDDTLAESFQAPSPEVTAALNQLQNRIPVAIMTGAGFPRIERQVLPAMESITSNFYLFPNSSSQCYTFKESEWHLEYNHIISPEERSKITEALHECMQSIDVIRDAPHFGQQIVDREAQIAFTIVGLEAPQEIKKGWDPDGAKRRAIVEMLSGKLSGYDILIGGASTIDITRKDINKASGVHWFSGHLGVAPQDMLYVGDALYPGGNDAVVIQTGVKTIQVSGPPETKKILDELLIACAS
jgi:phosphomannomutase